MALKIYGNLDRTTLSRGIVQSDINLIPRAAPNFVAGDSAVIDLYLTGQDGLLNIQDYSTVRLGLGSINARPTGGTWDLGSQTGLAYDISAAALDTAITAEVAACTVTQLASYVFKVVFSANGDQTIPTVDASALTPTSTVSIKTLVAGDGSTPEEWIIRLFQNPIALIDSWTNITGSGIRGSLNLGTEGVYDLLAAASSASTNIELELTDANGDVTTVFQVPCTLSGEVIGEGVTGVASFDSYITSTAVANKFKRGNLIFVDAVNGSDSTGTAGRADLPFLTCNAAEDAASSGDTIIVLPGDYSAESALSGKDGVNWKIVSGATSPSFNVSGAFTFTIDGDVGGSINVANLSADVTCTGNAGTFIFCGGGTLTAGNAGTFIKCDSGTLTAGNAGTFIECTGGTVTAGNAGTFIRCTGGELTIRNADQSHDGTDYAPIYVQSNANLTIENSRVESTESGGVVVDIAINWGGAFIAKNCDFVATTVGTNEATTGILYGSSVTGTVQLKDCTIITAATGTYVDYPIHNTATTTATVYIQGSLNATATESSYIEFEGGSTIINSNFTA